MELVGRHILLEYAKETRQDHEPLTDLSSARLGKLLLSIGQLMKCLVMEKMNLVETKVIDPESRCRQIESTH
jgi:hypothetical protein